MFYYRFCVLFITAKNLEKIEYILEKKIKSNISIKELINFFSKVRKDWIISKKISMFNLLYTFTTMALLRLL